MQLTRALIPALVDLRTAAGDDFDPAGAADAIRADVASGKRQLKNTRVLADGTGSLWAMVRVEPFAPPMWALGELCQRPRLGVRQRARAAGLIAEALEVARAGGAVRVETRIPVRALVGAYRRALVELGFAHVGDRVEFKTPIEVLPDDVGTPIRWQAMGAAGRTRAARLLGEVGRGDPDWDESDDPGTLLDAYLADADLTSSPDCVHVGRVSGRPAALVVAQVAPRTGWSRITYMGLVQAFRGQGLGGWVQRHGFAMLRAQGGRLYHGGTSTCNPPMLALFRRHRCREYKRFQEWIWRVPDAPSGSRRI